MGIGNKFRDRARVGDGAPLITPHGDWKHGLIFDVVEIVADRLITPHGDWKRPPNGSGSWRPRRSLPLMGIGNCFFRENRGCRGISHYPSWGLETHIKRPEGDRNLFWLITPHGDWKLAKAHREAAKQRRILITPHGDWKREVEAPLPGRVEASLPLMGIGNDQVVAEVAGGGALITPHGDWKHVFPLLRLS